MKHWSARDQATNFASSLPFLHRLRGDILLKRDPRTWSPLKTHIRDGDCHRQTARPRAAMSCCASLAPALSSINRPLAPADAYAVLLPALEGFTPDAGKCLRIAGSAGAAGGAGGDRRGEKAPRPSRQLARLQLQTGLQQGANRGPKATAPRKRRPPSASLSGTRQAGSIEGPPRGFGGLLRTCASAA